MKGKILFIICLLFFVFSQTLNAQWARTYGGSEDDYASSIMQTFDGGYVVAGSTQSFGAGYDEFQIFKLASDGTIEWQKTFGGNIYDYANSIRQTSDGGYILGGQIAIYNDGKYVFILKISSSGDVEWKHYYKNPLHTTPDPNSGLDTHRFGAEVRSIQQTNDGGYIAACQAYLSESDKYDIWILKLSPNGDVEWSRAYVGPLDERVYSIKQTAEGGYIFAGHTNSYGTGNYDLWILKIDLEGRIEWQKTYGGMQQEFAYSIVQTNGSGYIVAGSTFSYGAGKADFWLIKLSAKGNIEWQKTYGGSETETAYSIQQDFDGGYIVGGVTWSFGAGKNDIWILKLNVLGDIEWQKSYGGIRDEDASSIKQTNDGGYIVAGSTFSYGAGNEDFLVLNLFSNGEIDSVCGFINNSNADIFNTSTIPVNSNIDSVSFDIVKMNIDIYHQESDALEYGLCLGTRALNITDSIGGTTFPPPGTYIYDYAESIIIEAYPEEGYIFLGWSGDVLSTTSSVNITIDSDKSVKANFSENVIEKLFEDAKETPCFIATAAFGSPFHPYVIILQDFRDKYLMSSRPGRMFVRLYYKYSPHIAELITDNKALRTVVSIWLIPFVAMGYSMVHFGPIKTTMMFVISIMPLFFFVWFYRRRSKQD
ncbi:CFI-box-CTERM domain-containing protein [Acidobacteriota bacterium]